MMQKLNGVFEVTFWGTPILLISRTTLTPDARTEELRQASRHIRAIGERKAGYSEADYIRDKHGHFSVSEPKESLRSKNDRNTSVTVYAIHITPWISFRFVKKHR